MRATSSTDDGDIGPAGLLEALTVLGGALAWARTTLARAAPVFSGLDRIQASIERTIEDKQSALRHKYEVALEAEAAAQHGLAEAQQAYAQAENAACHRCTTTRRSSARCIPHCHCNVNATEALSTSSRSEAEAPQEIEWPHEGAQ